MLTQSLAHCPNFGDHRPIWSLGGDYASYSELFKRRGDLTRAKQKLNKAIEIFRKCEAEGWVEKHEKEIAALQ